MKKSTLIIVIIACLSVALGSCDSGAYSATPNKDQSHVPNPIYNKLGMSALINKVQWNASPDPTATIISAGGMNSLTILGTFGIDSTTNYQTIALTIFNYHGSGTYKLNDAGIANYIYDSSTAVPSLGGLIKVTSDDGLYVQGTFSFTAKNFNIQNGSFYAIHQ